MKTRSVRQTRLRSPLSAAAIARCLLRRLRPANAMLFRKPAPAATLREPGDPAATRAPPSEAAAAAASPRATLGQGELATAVSCPPGADEDEFVARHAVDFLDATSLLHAALAGQYCTAAACPCMAAGGREYLWAPPPPPAPRAGRVSRAPKPVRVPAPVYCANLFAWADGLLADPSAFPQAPDAPFPPDFRARVAAPLFKRLARVFAHAYHTHFDAVAAVGAVPHVNTVFKHFVAFGRAWGLVPESELDPVRELVDALLPPGREGGGGGGVAAAVG